jgi:hypothetical protein
MRRIAAQSGIVDLFDNDNGGHKLMSARHG